MHDFSIPMWHGELRAPTTLSLQPTSFHVNIQPENKRIKGSPLNFQTPFHEPFSCPICIPKQPIELTDGGVLSNRLCTAPPSHIPSSSRLHPRRKFGYIMISRVGLRALEYSEIRLSAWSDSWALASKDIPTPIAHDNVRRVSQRQRMQDTTTVRI